MHRSKMITGMFPVLALLAFTPLASAAGSYSFFVGYPDGYASYEAYVAGKMSATTFARATPTCSVEIPTRSKWTAATDFEPRTRTCLETQGTSLYSTKYRGVVMIIR